MNIVERCPLVTDITGTPVEEKGLIKGKMAHGVADMHFLAKGPKGDVHISLTGSRLMQSRNPQESSGRTARWTTTLFPSTFTLLPTKTNR